MKTYTTSRNIEIEFRPVSKELMLRFNAANPQPTVPTYDIKSEVTGTVEHIPLDEKSLTEKPEQFTPEQHAALKVYAEKNADFIMRFLKFFCIRGVTVKADMADWLDEQRFLNIPLPESKAELKFEWMINEVLATEDDYKAVVLGVIEASGVPSDLVSQVADSFRGDIQRDTAESVGNGSKQMEGVAELGRSASDVALANNIVTVGATKHTRPRVGTRHARDHRDNGSG